MTGALDWCSLLDDVCSHIVQTTIKILSIYYTHCIWESVTSNVIVIIDFYLHKTSDILGNPLFVSNVWATNIINVTTESSFCYVAGVLSARNTVWPASAWSGIMEQVSEKMWAQHFPLFDLPEAQHMHNHFTANRRTMQFHQVFWFQRYRFNYFFPSCLLFFIVGFGRKGKKRRSTIPLWRKKVPVSTNQVCLAPTETGGWGARTAVTVVTEISLIFQSMCILYSDRLLYTY